MTLSYPADVGRHSTGYSITTQEQVCLAPIVPYNFFKNQTPIALY